MRQTIASDAPFVQRGVPGLPGDRPPPVPVDDNRVTTNQKGVSPVGFLHQYSAQIWCKGFGCDH
ncbi:MAG: hypothetical protein AB2705_04485 [Candidatus Thiodiazotropha sp.]